MLYYIEVDSQYLFSGQKEFAVNETSLSHPASIKSLLQQLFRVMVKRGIHEPAIGELLESKVNWTTDLASI